MLMTFRNQAGTGWNPWSELEKMRNDMDRLFTTAHGWNPRKEYPALNAWSGEEDVIVRTELPGVSTDDVDISVVNDTLTIRGTRKIPEPAKERIYHRQERVAGDFVRSVQLPFHVDSDKVEARMKNGILEIRLPRAEAEKPKKIEISI